MQEAAAATACAILDDAEGEACQLRSMLCCPIKDTSGKTVAVLQALNKRDGLTFGCTDEVRVYMHASALCFPGMYVYCDAGYHQGLPSDAVMTSMFGGLFHGLYACDGARVHDCMAQLHVCTRMCNMEAFHHI